MAKAKSRTLTVPVDSANNLNSQTIPTANFSNNDQLPGDSTRCAAMKKDGSQCRARALVGQNYCSLHSDPERAAELGRRGGRRRAIFDPEELKQFSAPNTAHELVAVLAESIVDVRAARLEPKAACAIALLATNWLRARELALLESKVSELGRQLHAGETGSTP